MHYFYLDNVDRISVYNGAFIENILYVYAVFFLFIVKHFKVLWIFSVVKCYI